VQVRRRYAADQKWINRPSAALVVLLHLLLLALLVSNDRLSLPPVQEKSSLAYITIQPPREAAAPPAPVALPSAKKTPIPKLSPPVQEKSSLAYITIQPPREAAAPPAPVALPSAKKTPIPKLSPPVQTRSHPAKLARPRAQPGFIIVLPPDFSLSAHPGLDLKPPPVSLGPVAPQPEATTEAEKLKLFWQEQARLNAIENKPSSQDPGHRFGAWSGPKCTIETAEGPVQGDCLGLHF